MVKKTAKSINNYIVPIDIDECAEDRDGCTQTCTNTVGSYTCSCLSGYRLESDKHTCVGELYNNIPTWVH